MIFGAAVETGGRAHFPSSAALPDVTPSEMGTL
jgi:hypothetical protein